MNPRPPQAQMAPDQKPGVTRYRDHDVIVLPNLLKKKAVRIAAAGEPDPVAGAEKALEGLSAQFEGWMDDECAALDRARRSVLVDGLTDRTRRDLFRAAHDLKGHGATFGFPLAADVAASLCRLLEHADASRIPALLIDRCVDAVRAIIREHRRPDAERTAAELALLLRALTNEAIGPALPDDSPGDSAI